MPLVDYVERFYFEFVPYQNSDTFRVNFRQNGYVGSSTEIPLPDKVPVRDRTRGNKEFRDLPIQGAELEITFNEDPSDTNDYTDLLQAEEKEWIIEILKNSNLKVRGFLKPENITREWFGVTYPITVSMTDGLADLKNIDFVDSNGDPYTSRISGLQCIKNALEKLDPLEFDFKIQCNIYENNEMTSSDCVFEDVDFDPRRWIKEKDGKETYDNCYNVLQDVLNTFQCTIRQNGDAYEISNYNEITSYLYTFDWATLTQQSRVAHSDIVDVDSYDFRDYGSFQFIRPVKEVQYTFRNKYVGDNVFTNPDFDTTTGWSNGTGNNAFDSFGASGGQLVLSVTTNTADEKYFESDNINITTVGSEDKISFSIKVNYLNTVWTDPIERTPPSIKFRLVKPDASFTENGEALIQEGLNTYTSGDFELDQNGNYQLRVYLSADLLGPFSSNTYYVDDAFGQITYTGENDTLDKLFVTKNTGLTFTDNVTFENSFGDGEVRETGALSIGGNPTTEWRSYGGTEDVNLSTLVSQQYLKLYSKYKGYIRISIKDPGDNISAGTVLESEGIYYRFVNYSKDYGMMNITGEIIEVPTSALTTSDEVFTLSTEDGEGSSSSSIGAGATTNNYVSGGNFNHVSSELTLLRQGLSALVIPFTDAFELNVTGDTGTGDVWNTLNIVGNSGGISTSLSGNTLTITNLAGYSGWLIEDDVANTENIGSGDTLKIVGSGSVTTSYISATNTLTITGSGGTDTNYYVDSGSWNGTSETITLGRTSPLGDILIDLTGTYLKVGESAGNANLLDSLDSTQFLRSDTSDSFTSGTLTFNDNQKLSFGTGGASGESELSSNGTNTKWTLLRNNLSVYASDGSTERFRMDQNGNFHADANITAYSSTLVSDRRLKRDIQPLEKGLDIINRLKPVEYSYRKNREQRHFGFVAQDIEKILPELVSESELLGQKGKYKVLNETEIIPLLVKAVQEIFKRLE